MTVKSLIPMNACVQLFYSHHKYRIHFPRFRNKIALRLTKKWRFIQEHIFWQLIVCDKLLNGFIATIQA